MPWGLQTHIYAPANVDLRNTYKICGNEPGEPPETHEIGIGAPAEGLYLREDIEIKCNIAMTSFVKKETKINSKILIDRLVKKAELLDSGVLSATLENGKLKTANPADRSFAKPAAQHAKPPPHGNQLYQVPMSAMRLRNSSPLLPHEQQQQYNQPAQVDFAMELPGDYYHPHPAPQYSQPNDYRYSTASKQSGLSLNPSDGRWSHTLNESGVSSPLSSPTSDRMPSPTMKQKGFYEMPT